MQASALLTRPLAIVALIFLAVLSLISLGESLKVLSSSSILVRHDGGTDTTVKRSWDSEQGPFSPARPDHIDKDIHEMEPGQVEDDMPEGRVPAHDYLPDEVDSAHDGISGDDENLGLPGLSLPNPIATGISIVGCWLHGCSSETPAPGVLTQPPGSPAAPTDATGGGMFPSVLSILAGAPGATPAPGSPGENGPLGGLLSALSQAAPSPIPPTPGITAPPGAPIGTGGLLPNVGILGGVVSALDGVLGSLDESNNGGRGLMGQLSADLLDPIASIAANPASILANPSAAIGDLQSQVSAVLGSMPSAIAAGVQLASSVGGDLAEVLNATTDLLDSVPAVAGGVAGQVGSLLNAAPNLATGIPIAALDAVNQVGAVLDGVPDLGDGFNAILGGLKNDLSNAVADAVPQVSALAGVVNSQVVGVLPAALQPLVSEALSSLATATASPAQVSPDLASMLSSLSSSITSASPVGAATDTAAVNSIASSALAGLSSLISKFSQLSLTAAATPVPAAASATPSPSQPVVAETTIYYVQTITALITSTAVEVSTVTFCPSAFASYTLTYTGGGSPTGSGGWPFGSGSPPGDGSDAGPCPGRGYTCDECGDGWFCPPQQTPALPAPCGYGWPCYHCKGGWFCVPSPGSAGGPGIQTYPMSKPGIKSPTIQPDTNGYKYAGCYKDNPDRALRDAQLLTVAGGMTSGQCINFCSAQGFIVAGTEDSTQCFCGYKLLDSMILGDDQCHMNCAGDPTNMTTCGGPWALSIWSVDGSIEQGSSPEKQFTLATTAGWQHPGGVRYSKMVATTPIYAWPPFASSSSTGAPVPAPAPTATGMSGLESAILSAVAADAGGMALVDSASASGIIESVSLVLNEGMSSVASVLSLTAPAGNTPFILGPTDLPLGPGPVITSTINTPVITFVADTAATNIPTSNTVALDPMGEDHAADAGAVAQDGVFVGVTSKAADAEGDGSYAWPTLPGVNKGSRALRRRARWA